MKRTPRVGKHGQRATELLMPEAVCAMTPKAALSLYAAERGSLGRAERAST